MKILLAVHFVKMEYDCGDIFISAWDNFLKHHKKDLQCDVVFMSGGHPETKLKALAPNCNKCYVPAPFKDPNNVTNYGSTTQFGAAMNYNTIVDAGKYDFIFRIDHDAFTTTESINSICSFIRANPEIDWISPSNVPRSHNSPNSVINELYTEWVTTRGKKHVTFAPFFYPTNNGDFWGIRRDFFMELCERIGNPALSENWPYLLTSFKSYGEICDILGFQNPKVTEEVRKSIIYIDGFLGTDAWAHFCAMKPNAAGVLDKRTKASFAIKNILRSFAQCRWATSYFDIVDLVDKSYPHEKNALIDHIFHLESGYMIPVYFNSIVDKRPNPHGGFLGGFSPGAGYSYPATQYTIVKLLVERFGPKELEDQLSASMNKLFNYYKTDLDMLKQLEEIIRRLYFEQAMKEYIQ